VSDHSTTVSEPSLAVRIDREKSHPLPWKTVAKRAGAVVVAGLAIYLVFPAITEVLASWPRMSRTASSGSGTEATHRRRARSRRRDGPACAPPKPQQPGPPATRTGPRSRPPPNVRPQAHNQKPVTGTVLSV
jgi:hypothetical protein